LPPRFAHKTFRKPNKQQNNEQINGQKQQTEAKPNKKTAESAENVSALERLLKIKTYRMTSRHISRQF